MAWRILAPNFNADVSRVVVKIGHQNLTDQLVKVAIFLSDCLQLRGKRPN